MTCTHNFRNEIFMLLFANKGRNYTTGELTRELIDKLNPPSPLDPFRREIWWALRELDNSGLISKEKILMVQGSKQISNTVYFIQ